jgi:hypothetical protein
MGNRVVNGGNSTTQGTRGGRKAKKGQFGDRSLSSASGISPDRIQARLGSWISGSNSLTSRWTSVGLIAAGAGLIVGATGWLAAGLAAGAVGLVLWRIIRGKDKVPKSKGQTLEDAIRKAFFGKTDSIDDMSLARVRARLKTMPLSEVHGIWQTIANEVAVDCFDADGHVDVAKLETWMTFLGNAETFKKEPFCLIPHAEFMRSQMYRTCECLVSNRNGARDRLDAAASITVGRYGRSILNTMSKGRQTPLRSYEAILASLFTPHRQQSLPTCTMNSIINEETRNHLERLIAMYEQMLASGQLTFPSGYAVRQQSVVNGFLTVDLRNGGRGRAAVFEDITGGDPAKRTQQIARWREEGIEYAPSNNQTKKYKLRMPVRNMNDVLFAHFFQASNFGNSRIDHGDFGTMLIYAGHLRAAMEYQSVIQVDKSNLPGVIAALKTQAGAQKKLGYHYMRVGTRTTTATIVGGYNHSGHAENIDINALLALDLSTMEAGKAYPIGDRNWNGWDMSQDVPRLAVRKTNGTPPTFEFGTLRGSRFEKTNMTKFEVYNTNVNVRDAAAWAQFRP